MFKNFHITHCCVLHGCKYGDEKCPVANGVEKQDYLCESCESYFKLDLTPFKQTVDVQTMLCILNNKQNFIVAQGRCEIQLGQRVSLSVQPDFNLETEIKYYVEKYNMEKYFVENMINQFKSNNLKYESITSAMVTLKEYVVISI